MFSFIIALAALVIGYIFYGKFIEKTFGADNSPTPAVTKADGVDYIVMPTWKIFDDVWLKKIAIRNLLYLEYGWLLRYF